VSAREGRDALPVIEQREQTASSVERRAIAIDTLPASLSDRAPRATLEQMGRIVGAGNAGREHAVVARPLTLGRAFRRAANQTAGWNQ
jgi:hypothetical protein